MLPITSNQNLDGTKAKEGNLFQMEIKFQKYSLIKVTSPITISRDVIHDHKSFGFKVPMNHRRKIIKVWSKYMVWPLIK